MTFHEGLGHLGLSVKFGNDLDDVLNNFYDNGAVGFKRQVDQWKEDNPDAYEGRADAHTRARSEEHTSELQSLMRIPYTGFCLKNKISIISTSKVHSSSRIYILESTINQQYIRQ